MFKKGGSGNGGGRKGRGGEKTDMGKFGKGKEMARGIGVN
jgi:hypothetical protein